MIKGWNGRKMQDRLNSLCCAGGAALLFASALTAPSPLLAQSSAQGSLCMARPANDSDRSTFVAVVPQSEQQATADRDDAGQDCLIGPAELSAYRAKVCHLADEVPTAIQGQFEQEYNITPRALCDIANTLAGSP